MNLELEGKVALITGGAGAIGSEIARALIAEGASVYLADIRATEAAQRARQLGEQAHSLELDVTRSASAEAALAQVVRAAGRIDILVNCAGIIKAAPVLESSDADWDEVCAVNLSGVWYCARAAIPHMVARRYGKMVNLASIAAVRGGGLVGNMLYGVTKAGVSTMTKGLARELAPHGITVNAIGPSLVDTPLVQPYLTPDIRARLLGNLPMGRFSTAGDVARLALFLCSDVSAYITGETILVDGGGMKK